MPLYCWRPCSTLSNTKMSRFFQQASDSDDSENESSDSDFPTSSDDDSSSVSSVEQKTKGPSKWLKKVEVQEEEDSDDGKKAVRSAKDKKTSELRGLSKLIMNAVKIRDWITVSAEFDRLMRGVQVSSRFVIRLLVDLEEAITTFGNDKAAVKKMNGSTSKAYNAMKQKIKKETKVRVQEIELFVSHRVEEDESLEEMEKLERQKTAPVKVYKIVEEEVEDDDGFTTVNRKSKGEVDVFERLRTVNEARGKKNTDKVTQIKLLVELFEHVKSPYQHIVLLNNLLPTRFDYVMNRDMWNDSLKELSLLYDLLDEHKNVTIGPSEVLEEFEEQEKAFLKGEQVLIRGNVVAFVDRLDDEYLKSLQFLDPNTSEYLERLRDEPALYKMLTRASFKDDLDLLTLRKVEHLYYKVNEEIHILENEEDVVKNFCNKLYHTKAAGIRQRAILCYVFNLALNDNFNESRDILQMSKLENAEMDQSTQILYNRALVQIGLCSFRVGQFDHAHLALQDISSGGKIRELLSQGVALLKYIEKTPEQERLDKSKQLPFHMHFNLELLECVYFVCAMIIQVPLMVTRKPVHSTKAFRKMFDYHNKQAFTGPPENTRDYIMAASRAMMEGEWKESINFVERIKVWDLLPNKDKIMASLKVAVQEACLNTYIFTYSPFYKRMGTLMLSEMFSLPQERVVALVIRMIFDGLLIAQLDGDEQFITMTKGQDKLVLQVGNYLDKLSSFATELSL